MGMFILPYNKNSASAKLLAKELGITRIKREGSRFKGGRGKVVINWGCRAIDEEVQKCNVLNSPEAVAMCADKLQFFNRLSQAGIARHVPFTTEKEVALGWMMDGRTVMCRTILNGHSAQGLIVAENVDELVDAPLYTQYVPKMDEYRIHVFEGDAFITQRKAYTGHGGVMEPNWKVRNLANGYVFARNEDKIVPEDVYAQATRAFNSVPGLHFGSVDVIWNAHRKEAYVLEINTASGLTGTTIAEYAEKFKKYA